MHKEKVVHRDLNPKNIMVLSSDEKRLKIIDFNCSKLITNVQDTEGNLE
jgi:tRNA A-37 threonylcarbamoyl transferase component Bud32